MAYIEKRTHPHGAVTYRVRIRLNGLPAKSASFETRTEAKKWAFQMEAQMRSGRHFERQEELERTFSEFIDRYIEKELPKNPQSYIKQKMLLTWWKKHLGKYFLGHIAPSMIATLRDALLEEMTPRKTLRSRSTANRYLAALSKAFTVGIKEWGWLKENPVLKITRLRENKPRERYLDKGEIARLLTVCRKSKTSFLYAVVLFSLATGARKGEILGLTWNDIDFARMTATFRDTKNGETRTIPLSKNLLQSLSEERQKRVVPSTFVFPSLDGSQPADIRTAWENAVEEANLSSLCFHSLRHTAASHLAMGGASTLEIAAVLGHKTLAMVKRYSHLSISSTARVLHQMNEQILQVGNG